MMSTIRCISVIAFLFSQIDFGQTTVAVTAVQNGASFTSRIAPGGFVTIKGSNFTSSPQSAAIVPVPTTLGGVTVSVAGLSCPIYYVSATQINFLLPWETPVGSYPLIVTANGQTVGPINILITAEAPGIFQYGANRAAVQNFNGGNLVLNTPSVPAPVGSTIVAYVTGIGIVNNTPADGAYSPSSPLAQGLYVATATIGGASANVTFTGLTPGQVGLAQANIVVPNLPSGDYPLILTIAGLQSTAALVSVSSSTTGLPLILNQVGFTAAATSPEALAVQGAAHTNANVVVSGNYAYLCDSNGIAVIDVTTPAAPNYLSNFGEYDMNGAGEGCALYQGDLLAFTSAQLNVYSLATPASPQRIGQNQFYFGNTFFSGSMAYVSTQSYENGCFSPADCAASPNPGGITAQAGEFYVYDMTNPALPKLDAQLVQNFMAPGSADTSPREGLTVINNQTAIVLGTSAMGSATNGQALWTTIDVSTPTKPSVIGQTNLPGSILINLAMQGNQALIAGNTDGVSITNATPQVPIISAPFGGDLTLALVDFTNPLNTSVLSTLTTPYSASSGYQMVSLGSGFFAITYGPPLSDLGGPTMLGIVDVRNPSTLVLYPEYGIDGLQGLYLANGYLYAASNEGLTIYSVTPSAVSAAAVK